jgi:hypothetical protein
MQMQPPAAPIFIAAPARRCGTTLLQRALNSTGRALVYGENFNFMENYPAIVAGVLTRYELRKSRTREVREQVLAGGDIDASAMFPDYDAYGRLMREHFYRIARYYDQQTRGYGREIWGVKHQIRRLDGFATFLRLLPRARYVFVYRNVFDVARSDKARFPGDYSAPESFALLGRSWARHTEFLRRIASPSVLHLEYDDLTQRPQEVINRVEAHCHVSGIDPGVFRRRLNVSPVIDRLSEPEKQTAYREPVGLTSAELNALRPIVEQACSRFGYAVT